MQDANSPTSSVFDLGDLGDFFSGLFAGAKVPDSTAGAQPR